MRPERQNRALDESPADLIDEITSHARNIVAREQQVLDDVDRVLQNHDGVAAISEELHGKFRHLSLVQPDTHAEELRSLKQGVEASLQDRLLEVQRIAGELPEMRAHMEHLTRQARNAADRSKRMSEKVHATVERMGGVENLDLLRDIPGRVAHEAELARREIDAYAGKLKHELEARVQHIATDRLGEIVDRADDLIASTMQRLELIEGHMVDLDTRIESSLEEIRTDILRRVEAFQRQSAEVERSLHAQMTAYALALKETERSLRSRFEDWFMQAATDYVSARGDEWQARMTDLDYEVQTRVEAVTLRADRESVALKSRIGHLEADSARLRQHIRWMPVSFAAIAGVAILLFLVFRPSQTVSTAPLSRPAVGDVQIGPATQEPAPAPQPEPISLSAEPAAPAPVEIAPETGYAWIVASSPSKTDAEIALRLYQDRGVKTRILESEVDGQTRYRVAVGAYDTQQAALSARNALNLPAGAWLLHAR